MLLPLSLRPRAACKSRHPTSKRHARPSCSWLPAQVFLTPNYLGIVTDFADQGELATQITKQAAQSGCADMAFTELEARHLFQQLIIAVDFCHRKGISNRDLKVWSADSLASRSSGWLPGIRRALGVAGHCWHSVPMLSGHPCPGIHGQGCRAGQIHSKAEALRCCRQRTCCSTGTRSATVPPSSSATLGEHKSCCAPLCAQHASQADAVHPVI